MDRLFTKDATGTAPNGRWYAGDINSLQDAVAAESDFTQAIDLASVRVGDSSIQLLKYGTAEARITAALRIDGILRGLGGIYAGAFTTTQRDALAVAARPYGLIILNTTTNQIEWNSGSDVTPNWKPAGVDPSGSLVFFPQTALNYFINSRRSADSFNRFRIREDGRLEFGGGTLATDTVLERTAPGVLQLGGQNVTVANDPGLANNVKVLAKPDPFDISNNNAETDLLSFTIPGGSMGSKGELHYYMYGRFTHPSSGSGTVMTFRLYWGVSTLVGSWVVPSSGSAAVTGLGMFEVFVRNNGGQGNQRIYVNNQVAGFNTTPTSVIFTATRDTTVDQLFRVTCQQAAADASHALEIYTHLLERR